MPILLVLAVGGAAIAAAFVLRPGGILAPSEHFTLGELTTTSQPLPNVPGPLELFNLGRLARDVLEPLRSEFGPLRVTSGYRSPMVNAAVGGSATSAHLTGLAADLVPLSYPGGVMAMFERIRATNMHRTLGIDQVIVYPARGHLHVGLRVAGSPRHQIGIQGATGGVQWLA